MLPGVWCLCVCAWPREVPRVGLPQPRRGAGEDLGARAHRTPPTLAAQSVVLEPGPQPQYCHLCPYTRESLKDFPRQKLPSREKLCQLWRGDTGLGPRTSVVHCPGTDEQLRLWPLPHPKFSPSAVACWPPLLPAQHCAGLDVQCFRSLSVGHIEAHPHPHSVLLRVSFGFMLVQLPSALF